MKSTGNILFQFLGIIKIVFDFNLFYFKRFIHFSDNVIHNRKHVSNNLIVLLNTVKLTECKCI